MNRKMTTMLRFAFSAIFLTSLISLSSVPVLADTTILYVAPGGLQTGACDSWANACDLQYALINAPAFSQLFVKEGTYTPGLSRSDSFILRDNVAIYGGFAGTTEAALTDRTAGHPSILSGDIGTSGDAGDNSYHVVSGSTDSTAILDSFMITAGQADGSAPDDSGAGFFNSGGSPTLSNLTFSANHASGNGGAIYDATGSAPQLTNVTFTGNSAGLTGGAIFNTGSSPDLKYVTFSGNTALGGGAMASTTSSSPVVHDSIFWGDGSEIANSGGSTTSVTYSVVQSGYTGTGNLSADPGLGSLADNGGFVQTISISPDSSARDAGDSATCGTVSSDERAVTRAQGSACDAGAYELVQHTISGNAGAPLVVLSYNDSSTARTVTAAGDGSYSLYVSDNWTGTVTPALGADTFTPTNRPYSGVVANQSGQDYIAVAPPATATLTPSPTITNTPTDTLTPTNTSSPTLTRTPTRTPTTPPGFSKVFPWNLGTSIKTKSLTLTWHVDSPAPSYYRYCVSTAAACDGHAVDGWTNVFSGTSVTLAITLHANAKYYWQVESVTCNSGCSTKTNKDSNSGAWWSFTTAPLPTATVTLTRTPGPSPTATAFMTATRTRTATATPTTPPGFSKIYPWDMGTRIGYRPLTLSWAADSPAPTYYRYCVSTSTLCDGHAVDGWTNVFSGRTKKLTVTLLPNTVYYWQVQSVVCNDSGCTDKTNKDSNHGSWWSFTTGPAPTATPRPTATLRPTPTHPASLTISGSAGVAGARLTFGSKIVVANSTGHYSLVVPYGWSGTVTPSLLHRSFSPDHRVYTSLTASISGQSYTASQVWYISGNVGVAGATLNFTDSTPKTVMTDGAGNYVATVSNNWTGSLTPTKTGFTFSPASLIVSVGVTSDQTGQNFTPSPPEHMISGGTSVGGALLSFDDGIDGVQTVISDGNGHYLLRVPDGWAGIITPSKSGVTFTPASLDYSSAHVTTDLTGQSFAATLTFTSTGALDGTLLESGANTRVGGGLNSTNTTFLLGDDAQNRQYRAILSFNTAALPDTATISAVQLRIRLSATPVGPNPFSILGTLWADIRKGSFGTSALQVSDFNAAASSIRVGAFNPTPVSNWYSDDLNINGLNNTNKLGLTQLRLYFNTHSNNNAVANYVTMRSGNYSAVSSRPQLVVTFSVP